MRIQFLKTLVDGNETTRKGTIVDIDQWKARELIAMGYAVHLPEIEESVAAPLAIIAANDNAREDGQPDDPFEEPQTGSPDGSERPASLSPEAPARQKRKYTKRKDAAA